ncbi:MAG TPA: hypothetical protein VF538_01820 [Pyrinomonadaceae bacterium]|jgi:hypothetical protein
MARFTNALDRVRIAAPCEADWDEMQGGERVRFCQRCSLNVYNLSSMTRREAERLVTRTEGARLCVRFYRRRDGTMLTRSCPVGSRALKRRASRVTSATFAAIASFLAGVGIAPTKRESPVAVPPQAVIVAPPVASAVDDEMVGETGYVMRGPPDSAFVPAGILAGGLFIVGYPLMKLRARREAKRREELHIWRES